MQNTSHLQCLFQDAAATLNARTGRNVMDITGKQCTRTKSFWPMFR